MGPPEPSVSVLFVIALLPVSPVLVHCLSCGDRRRCSSISRLPIPNSFLSGVSFPSAGSIHTPAGRCHRVWLLGLTQPVVRAIATQERIRGWLVPRGAHGAQRPEHAVITTRL
jgi:hypothetical protein